jgi:hypothetical protein
LFQAGRAQIPLNPPFPKGETQSDKHTEEVIPRVKRFKEFKQGDEVVVRHTETLAISAGKP